MEFLSDAGRNLVSEGANGMYYVTDLCLVGCAHLAGRMINKINFAVWEEIAWE